MSIMILVDSRCSWMVEQLNHSMINSDSRITDTLQQASGLVFENYHNLLQLDQCSILSP
jgi:hypothetical protein